MSEERLQELKDSINFQYELIVSKGIDKSALLFTDEEQELLEEVERLHSIIKEVRERLIKPSKFIERTERLKLLEILDKENSNGSN